MKFYTQKDGLGFPVLGTLMSAEEVPATDNVIEVKPFMGLGQHPQGFKYYVRKNQEGGILVNSLFVSFDVQDSATTIDLHLAATTTTTTIAPTTTTTTVSVPQE